MILIGYISYAEDLQAGSNQGLVRCNSRGHGGQWTRYTQELTSVLYRQYQTCVARQTNATRLVVSVPRGGGENQNTSNKTVQQKLELARRTAESPTTACKGRGCRRSCQVLRKGVCSLQSRKSTRGGSAPVGREPPEHEDGNIVPREIPTMEKL